MVDNPSIPPRVANPMALAPEALARMLGLSLEVIQRHLEEGAPLAPDGTINLVHYAAWLNLPATPPAGEPRG